MIVLLPALLAAALAATPLEDHLAQAEAATRAERELRPDEAVEACRRAVEVLPDGPRSPRCVRRVTFLEARRDADGGFTGWIALERARQAFATRGADATRADVARLLQQEGLATAVRGEAATWLAADDLDRLGDPAAALARTDALYAERAQLDEDLRRLLITTRARALAQLGRAGEAKGVEDEIRVAAPAPRPTPVERELGAQTNAARTQAAWVTLALFAAAALPGVPRALRAGPRPWGLVPLGVAVGGAWLIGVGWGEGAGDVVPWLGAGFAVVHGLAVLGRPPDSGRARRVIVGVLAAAATVAAAWLALVRADALAWVGL